jgi:hypothetical protein
MPPELGPEVKYRMAVCFLVLACRQTGQSRISHNLTTAIYRYCRFQMYVCNLPRPYVEACVGIVAPFHAVWGM